MAKKIYTVFGKEYSSLNSIAKKFGLSNATLTRHYKKNSDLSEVVHELIEKRRDADLSTHSKEYSELSRQLSDIQLMIESVAGQTLEDFLRGAQAPPKTETTPTEKQSTPKNLFTNFYE